VTDLLPILRDFGFPIALCVALLWAIMQQNRQLVKAYTDRITVLERLVREVGAKVEALELDRMRRADEYAHSIKDLAVRFGDQAREFTRTIKEVLPVLHRLVDALGGRPCMHDPGYEYKPHHTPRPPTVADLPREPETDRRDRK